MNDDTVYHVSLFSCRFREEPRFEIFERETVIRCELLDVVVSHAVDVAQYAVCLAHIDERDALIADFATHLHHFDVLRAVRLVLPLTYAHEEVTVVHFLDVMHPPIVIRAYRVQLALVSALVGVVQRVAEMLTKECRFAVPWVCSREHS